MANSDAKNIINTIPIKNLMNKESVNDSDILVIEDESATYKINAKNLADFIRETVKDTFIQLAEKGAANGIVPLDSNAKIASEFLSYGKSAGTVYEGSHGKSLEDTVSAHCSDTKNPHKTTALQLGLGNVENKNSDTIRAEITAENVIHALGYEPEVDGAYENAVAYIDTKISQLINNAPESMDTLKEIADALSNNQEVMDTLNTLISKKANQSELDTHTGNGTIHVTALDKSNLSAVLSHSRSSHARTDATKSEKSATNGNLLINGSETVIYQHPLSGAKAGTYRQVTIDSNGHVTGGNNAVLPITQGGTGASTSSGALSNLGITADASELNKLDGVAITTKELNYVSGATSNLQTQLNGKAALKHGEHLPGIGTGSAGQFITSTGTTAAWHKLSKNDISEALGYVPGTGSNIVTAVKGSAETEYQTGNVNITPAKLGLGNVDNTHDNTKSVLSAAKLVTARKIGNASFDGTKDLTLAQMGALGASNLDAKTLLADSNGKVRTKANLYTASGRSSENNGWLIEVNETELGVSGNDIRVGDMISVTITESDNSTNRKTAAKLKIGTAEFPIRHMGDSGALSSYFGFPADCSVLFHIMKYNSVTYAVPGNISMSVTGTRSANNNFLATAGCVQKAYDDACAYTNQKTNALNLISIGSAVPAANSTYLIWINTTDHTMSYRINASSATWITLASTWT